MYLKHCVRGNVMFSNRVDAPSLQDEPLAIAKRNGKDNNTFVILLVFLITFVFWISSLFCELTLCSRDPNTDGVFKKVERCTSTQNGSIHLSNGGYGFTWHTWSSGNGPNKKIFLKIVSDKDLFFGHFQEILHETFFYFFYFYFISQEIL